MPTEMRELATFLYQSTPLRVGQIHTTLLQLHGEEMRWTFDDIRNIVQRGGRPQSQDAAELIKILQVRRAWHSARGRMRRALLRVTNCEHASWLRRAGPARIRTTTTGLSWTTPTGSNTCSG